MRVRGEGLWAAGAGSQLSLCCCELDWVSGNVNYKFEDGRPGQVKEEGKEVLHSTISKLNAHNSKYYDL